MYGLAGKGNNSGMGMWEDFQAVEQSSNLADGHFNNRLGSRYIVALEEMFASNSAFHDLPPLQFPAGLCRSIASSQFFDTDSCFFVLDED